MTTTRRPEDVTAEEVRRTMAALLNTFESQSRYHGTVEMNMDCVRNAIASGLLVPPPRERTQMEKDEEEWCLMRSREGTFSKQDAVNMSFILSRLFRAAKAAGVTY